MPVIAPAAERQYLLQLWNANKASIAGDNFDMDLDDHWGTVAKLTFRDALTPTAKPQVFIIEGRNSHSTTRLTRIRVNTTLTKRHVLLSLCYSAKRGALTAGRLVQDLRGGDDGAEEGGNSGQTATATATAAGDILCCGEMRPCECGTWVDQAAGWAEKAGGWVGYIDGAIVGTFVRLKRLGLVPAVPIAIALYHAWSTS